MKFRYLVCVFMYVFVLHKTFAVELKDATLRDENISAVELTVEYSMRPDGLMEYVYRIDNPLVNIGKVSRLIIDLECSFNFEYVTLPYASNKDGYTGDHTLNNDGYSPVAIKADYGASGIYGITSNKEAHWGLASPPGENINGLRLISPAKPGIRTYVITPWVDYSEGGWDLPEDLSLVPKAYDFAITGMIAAPGCPGVTEPPSETNLFAGTGFRVEPENINKLLQYRIPQKDRFHVDAGTKETILHIFYSNDMDAKTFKVQPAWMKHYFNPVAGTDEKVTLSLRNARNKIKLSVHTKKSSGTTRKNNDSHHSYKDTDVFEIRIDGNKSKK